MFDILDIRYTEITNKMTTQFGQNLDKKWKANRTIFWWLRHPLYYYCETRLFSGWNTLSTELLANLKKKVRKTCLFSGWNTFSITGGQFWKKSSQDAFFSSWNTLSIIGGQFWKNSSKDASFFWLEHPLHTTAHQFWKKNSQDASLFWLEHPLHTTARQFWKNNSRDAPFFC